MAADSDQREVLLAEYHELGANMREEASYRFRIMALLLTVYGGVIAAMLQSHSAADRRAVALVAVSAGIYFFLAEYRAAEHWYAFERRQKKIETQLGMSQWRDHELPGIGIVPLLGRLNTTWWTRAFMLLGIFAWAVVVAVLP